MVLVRCSGAFLVVFQVDSGYRGSDEPKFLVLGAGRTTEKKVRAILQCYLFVDTHGTNDIVKTN